MVKIEDGKQELSGLQIGGLDISPCGEGGLKIHFTQAYRTFGSSLQIHVEFENPSSVP